ncbi:MAG: BPL-N domain-containing protein [Pirellulaceae bacterium]|nr:BPL-N domain-containing protein [Pirellulaceae bacterium]
MYTESSNELFYRLPKWLLVIAVMCGFPQGLAHGQDRLTKTKLSEYVFSQAGELPIILSAPHGGTKEIPGVAKRKGEGLPTGGAGYVVARDTGTEELALEVAEAIRARFGKAPYVVVSQTHRQFLDPNRPKEIAFEDSDAKPIYEYYHETLAGFCRDVTNTFHSGLLLDLHGQGVQRETVFRGTRNGTTVKHLREAFGEAAHSGEKSLFGNLKSRGWVVHPVPMTEKEQAGLNGGYIVGNYGSANGSSIDAIQLEFGAAYRAKGRRAETASALAEAVADYASAYLKVEVPEATVRKPVTNKKTVPVAVFVDSGVSPTDKLMAALAADSSLDIHQLSAADIREGKLKDFSVIVFPGGSGSKQGNALGEEGRERVRDFVRSGKGLVGICAGAYLASCDYTWSLNVLDAKVVDRAHWNRGFGNVDITMSKSGRELLGADTYQANIYYHQGPLLAPAKNDAIPDYEPLAFYLGEIAKNNAPKGVMPGTTAIARGKYEKGRVFCFSPHPEKTPGLESMVLEAIDWVNPRKD